jgi:uncharacterized protein (DUF697 family)
MDKEMGVTPLQKRKCRRIIHGSAFIGGLVASGLAQIPASDNAVLVPLEIIMVLALGHVFGIRLRHSYRISLILTAAATMIGRAVSEVLVGWIPVIGNLFDALTAIAVIEGLGWMVAKEFKRQEIMG